MIAGLPESTASVAAATIRNRDGPRWSAVAGTFPTSDNAIYVERPILDLGILSSRFALREERDRNGVPTPSRIVVAYVHADGSDRLWDVFGHAVWPHALRIDDWGWRGGRHWRHDVEAVNRILRQALEEIAQGPAEAMRLRLEARRCDDALLLPGRNFQLDEGGHLSERFRAFMEGRSTLEEVERGIRSERFSFERLSKFYIRTGGTRKRFAVDRRNLVFAKANVGQDGGLVHLDADGKPDAPSLRHVLEGRYRFGTPLIDAGFQHDVQKADNQKLQRERFDCALKGEHFVSGDHANVFSSDVVTG
ncbi:hypothetical protein [Aureimonas phyllosphaerae]|uniref:Uncharacterized protein n=1 Tax=Aureimonas phyllosphaerae TaxID=1166078 RepID=A0A7W6FVF3_9HYPH|nr:hypothetical protein [Aureimonas phyllosphaerae]MBB3937214.1 hypothetical protein [Aureimonas phyllosphaerae]MBB3961149.1 hypothetical protein [Aureimonas phyllosphaerae]